MSSQMNRNPERIISILQCGPSQVHCLALNEFLHQTGPTRSVVSSVHIH